MESTRATQIRELCARARMPDVADRLIESGRSPEWVRQVLFDAVCAREATVTFFDRERSLRVVNDSLAAAVGPINA